MYSDYKINQTLSNFLNLLRWFSAFIVIIGHLRSILFLDIKDIGNINIFWKIFYFFTGFGHQAVIVFFVVSGFLVGGSILKRYDNNQLSAKKYLLKDRAIRIYIVLIPALLLTYILDFLGSYYLNSSGIYSGNIIFSSLNYDISSRLGIDTLFGNIVMLQESFFSTFGSNSPLWSLAYEVWYYILFFSIMSLFNVNKPYFHKILLIIIILLIMYLLNEKIILYFSIWLIGIIGWFFHKNNKIIFYLSTILLFSTLFLSRLHIYSGFYIDFIFAISIIMLIIYFKNKKLKNIKKLNYLNKKLADFSYTLYLIHFPLIIFLVAYFSTYSNFTIQSLASLNRLFIFLGFIIFIYLIAYLFAYFTELKTKQIQKRLLNEN